MLNLFESKRDKRIEELFELYKRKLMEGRTDDEALMVVWGELNMGNISLKDQFSFLERGIDSRRELINELFPSLEAGEYDIFQAIKFTIIWEFPEIYNRDSYIRDIEAEKDAPVILEQLVKEIGNRIL